MNHFVLRDVSTIRADSLRNRPSVSREKMSAMRQIAQDNFRRMTDRSISRSALAPAVNQTLSKQSFPPSTEQPGSQAGSSRSAERICGVTSIDRAAL